MVAQISTVSPGILFSGLFDLVLFLSKAKTQHSNFFTYFKNLFPLISGFTILVFGFFPVPDFWVARQQALPAQTSKATKTNEHELPNERKANESPNTTQTEQTDRRLRVQKTAMLYNGRK